ncbi:MAG TPA: hypothetical protein VGD94_01830 [Vicinamibacterales bacterium]
MKDQNRAGARAQASAVGHNIVAVPRRWLIAALAVILAPWLVVSVIYLRSADPLEGPEPPPGVSGSTTAGASGPWGRLSKTPIIVSPPLEYVAADWGRDEGPYRWYFPGASPELLRAFLSSAGLGSDQVARFVAAARPESRISGLILQPDLDLLRSLDPQVRARLYLQLAKSTLNADQANSFRFFGTSTDQWFAGTMISPATRGLIEPLIYRDGDIMHFADAELVRRQIKDPAELQRLAKALLRQPTVLVRLSVDRSSEINELAQYWGRGGRSTDIRPLLESVAGAGEQGSIDIVHLLPSFARNRLYRYPQLTTGDLNKPALANCLWTALNFFAAEPDDRYLDVVAAITSLRQDYHIVESNYQLGDIIALLDAEGDLFHVVVYLADDLVFTKNGTSPVAPWTIMPLDRVKDYYRNQSDNPRLIYHRRNDL